MLSSVIGVHSDLLDRGRLPTLTRPGERISAGEVVTLCLCGFVAALCTAFLDLDLRIPGHSIIRAIFPMAFGFALVPRRSAGTIMGTTALATSLGLKVGGFAGMGTGAMTSLFLTGPLLDLSLMYARAGWQLYWGFMLAGVVSNLVALVVRGAAKLWAADQLGGRRFGEWLPQAVMTYLLCGAVAGLVSAFFWFQHNQTKRSAANEDCP
ncbi:MAG: hypothetical protein HY000_03510 [Planctomycetes bacterium]|nr:hypothetical protein [Planctomycetota bacterium]